MRYFGAHDAELDDLQDLRVWAASAADARDRWVKLPSQADERRSDRYAELARSEHREAAAGFYARRGSVLCACCPFLSKSGPIWGRAPLKPSPVLAPVTWLAASVAPVYALIAA
jgi:hypothetical protein